MKTTITIITLTSIFACLTLSAQEMQPARGGALAERFKQLDTNGDGKISREEGVSLPFFDAVDGNKDGFVTTEEAQTYFAARRTSRPAAPEQPSAPLAAGELTAVDAVFELCVRDVEACAKFYRDGIGMREVEPANANGALLEWAGSYLRLRKVPGEKPAPATGNPMKQMLSQNGFRWFSLWFDNPAAISERLVKSGYPAPVKGANVSMTRDPDGNVVEIMGVPRSASGETFTWGMGVSDEAAARKFYGETLGLQEFDPWNLPPPFSMRMYLFATGSGRVKFSAPQGERPREADAGPDAPGLRSVTLRVADLAAVRDGLAKRGAKIQGEKRLLVTDPDGNRIFVEQAPPEANKAAATRPATPASRPQSALERIRQQYGDIKPTPHTEEIAEQKPGEPPLKKMPDGDAARDAAGRGQLFESIVVPSFTSIQEGMNGVAIADLNKDGLLDIVATYSAPRGTGGRWGEGEKWRVFINDGGFKFHPHTIKLIDSKVSMDSFGRGQVPNLADFNGDGFLDLFVTRHAQMQGGQSNPRDQKTGNGLYLSEGAWDTFRDVSEKLGIQNEKAYNRQPSFGDVNKDGWLDIAIGCDNIKDAQGGVPHSRLYVFKPNGAKFEDGHFEDIGGTDLVPDFGGFHHDSTKDKAGPDINLCDLDNDGDLDLIQSFHVDVLDLAAPYSPIEYRQGVFCWKNLLKETGELRFEKITGNGLACEAHLKLSADKRSTELVGKAPGLPYISLADVDNDGLQDVLAVGPASPGWAPRTEYVSGRFWRNKGNFQFQEMTDAAGLSALNWVYRDWCRFFEMPEPQGRPGAPMQPGERRPYFADAVFGDFNNDGSVDLVIQDRHDVPNLQARAILFMNRGDGTFDPKPTTFSGLDGKGICGEAADLNNDGLLDLVFAADPDNSGIVLSMAGYESKVYWNTGLHGGKKNHWLRLRFSGVKDAELIGARVEISTADKQQFRWIHANHSYKSGGALEAHFGLGKASAADVRITLPSGKSVSFPGVKADQAHTLNLEGKAADSTTKATPAAAGPKPNIIIFLADDLGYADIGANGCKDIPTPHIDSLAKNGVRFTDGYATHSVCSPSRAGLMSGRYQHRFGFEHNSGPERFAAENFGLPRTEPTLAERLKAAGYATGMVGKWHIGFKEGLRPHERGFDFHYGFLSGARSYYPDNSRESDPIIRNGVVVKDEKEYLTDAFAREAVAFLDRSKEKPFFLYVAFNAVHSPMEAPDRYAERFPELTGTRRTYAGMLAAMDDAVGRVLSKVRDLGQEENTLIFFYSDNGGPTPQTTSRNDPLRGYKGQFYEGGIRVPFLAQWKGKLPTGTVYREMVMGFDCHATTLAAAGVPLPTDKPLDGTNLLPFLTSKQTGRPHDQLFWRAGEQNAARVGDWKLVQERGGAPQIFNLKNDIGEQTNLAAKEPEKLRELQAAYAAWDKQMMPAQWRRQDARTQGAGANPEGGRRGGGIVERFKQFDRNGDGKLTRDEFPQPGAFAEVDADGDGIATVEEVRAWFTKRRNGRAKRQ
jgi:arylsulfatase A-like enzyme/catechol 2,3-dioxygenase-like lactoylglutathione lyase family enzyme